ncbi:unnamed protein product [Tilletia controversa]|nr:unnamed protein product [Tilletia controversa]
MPKKRSRQASTASKAPSLADEHGQPSKKRSKGAQQEGGPDRDEDGQEALARPRKGILSRFTSFIAPKAKKRKVSHNEAQIPSGSASSSSAARHNDDSINRTDSAALLALVRNQDTPFRRAINAVTPTDPSQLADSSFPGVAPAPKRFQPQSDGNEASTSQIHQTDAMPVDQPEPFATQEQARESFADEILAAAAAPHRRRQRSRITPHPALITSPTAASEKVEDSEPEADEEDDDSQHLGEASFSFDSLTHPPSELALGTPTKRLRSGMMAMAPEDSSHIFYSGSHHGTAVGEGSSSRRRARSRSAGVASKGKRRASSVGRQVGGKEGRNAAESDAEAEGEDEPEEEEEVKAPSSSPPVTRALARRIAVQEASQEDSPASKRRSARLAGDEVTLSDAEESQAKGKAKEDEDEAEEEGSDSTPTREPEHENSNANASASAPDEQHSFETLPDMLATRSELVLPGSIRPKRLYGHGRKIGVGSADARARSSMRTRRSQTVETEPEPESLENEEPRSEAAEEGPSGSLSAVKDEEEEQEQDEEQGAASDEDEDQAEVSALALSPSKSLHKVTSDQPESPTPPSKSKKARKRRAARRKSAKVEEQEEEEEEEEAEQPAASSERSVLDDVDTKKTTAEDVQEENARVGSTSTPPSSSARRRERRNAATASREAASPSASTEPEPVPISAVALRKAKNKRASMGKGKKEKGKGKGKEREREADSDSEMVDGAADGTRQGPVVATEFTDRNSPREKEDSPEAAVGAGAYELPVPAQEEEEVAKEEEREDESVPVAVPVQEKAEQVPALVRERPNLSTEPEAAMKAKTPTPVPAESPVAPNQEEASSSPAEERGPVQLPTVPSKNPEVLSTRWPEPVLNSGGGPSYDSLLPPGSTSARQAEADAFIAEAANGGGIPSGIHLPTDDGEGERIGAVGPSRGREEEEVVVVVGRREEEVVLEVPDAVDEVELGLGREGVDLLLGGEERIRLGDGAVTVPAEAGTEVEAEAEPVAVVPELEEVSVPLAHVGADLSQGNEDRIRLDDGEVIEHSQAETVSSAPTAVGVPIFNSTQDSLPNPADIQADEFSPLESTPPTSSLEFVQPKTTQEATSATNDSSTAGQPDSLKVSTSTSSPASSTSEEDELGSRASAIQQRRARAERKQKQKQKQREEDEKLTALMEAARDDGAGSAEVVGSSAVTRGEGQAVEPEADVVVALPEGEDGDEERPASLPRTEEVTGLTDADVAVILQAVAAEHPGELRIDAPPPAIEEPNPAPDEAEDEELKNRQTDALMDDLFDFPIQERQEGTTRVSPQLGDDQGATDDRMQIISDEPGFEMEQVPSQSVTVDPSAIAFSLPIFPVVPALNLPTPNNEDLLALSSASRLSTTGAAAAAAVVDKGKGKARAMESGLQQQQRSIYEPLQVFDDSLMAADDQPSSARDGGFLQATTSSVAAGPAGAVFAVEDEDAEDEIMVPAIDYRNLYPSLPVENGRLATNSPLGDEEKENQTFGLSDPNARSHSHSHTGDNLDSMRSAPDGREVIDMTASDDENGSAVPNGGGKERVARNGNSYTIGSRQTRLSTPQASQRLSTLAQAQAQQGPLTPRSRMTLALSPDVSPGPEDDSDQAGTQHQLQQQTQPSAFVFGPLTGTTSERALEDARREAEMRERVNRGEFLPLDRNLERNTGRASSRRARRIAYAAAGMPDEEEEVEEQEEEEYSMQQRLGGQTSNPLFMPPTQTAFGAQPWSYISAPSGSRTPTYAQTPRALTFDADYAGSAARSPIMPKRRAGRNSLGSTAAGAGGNPTRGSLNGSAGRKSGAMVGRVSGVGSLMPMGHDDYKHKIAAQREKQLKKLMAKHYEAMRRENSKLKMEDFVGLAMKGLKQMKADESEATRSLPQKSDEHYMEEFMKALRARALSAQRQRIPISQHKLKHYERLRKDNRRRSILVRGVLGRPPLPATLTPEQKEAVEQIFKLRGIIKEFPGASVSDHDIACLKPGTWLNDESINMYGYLMIKRSERAVAERKRLAAQGRNDPRNDEEVRRWHSYWNAHFFTSHFLGKYERDGHKGVARWTGRKGVNLFEKDIVLLPKNCGNSHWTCGAINFRKKRFEYYDSMAGFTRSDTFFKTVRQYLLEEHKAVYKQEMDLSGWTEYHSKESPHQLNGFDCGVFASQTLEQLSRRDPRTAYPSKPAYVFKPAVPGGGHGGGDGESDEGDEEDDEDDLEMWNFSQDDMPYLRRRMVYELGRAELLEP